MDVSPQELESDALAHDPVHRRPHDTHASLPERTLELLATSDEYTWYEFSEFSTGGQFGYWFHVTAPTIGNSCARHAPCGVKLFRPCTKPRILVPKSPLRCLVDAAVNE